ncbi:MAG: hypothetical protein ACLPVO_08700 [Desulfomonilaceae bacterium]
MEINKVARACIVEDGILDISSIFNLLASSQIVAEVFSASDQALLRQKQEPFDLLIIHDDPSTGAGLKLAGEFLKINWMTSTIVICDQDESIIHDRAEGLGILGHLRNSADLKSLAQLLTKFKQLSPIYS